MADLRGISYIRTTRGAYPVLYGNDEQFPIGGSKVVRQSPGDVVTLIGAGVTLHACIAAAERLSKSDISCRVIDLYSVKPIDIATLRAASDATAGRLVVVEDHYPEGGLGAAVMEALALDENPPRVTHLAVRDLPGSASPEELMAAAGIDADAIVAAVNTLIGAAAEAG
jgi:transketolase